MSDTKQEPQGPAGGVKPPPDEKPTESLLSQLVKRGLRHGIVVDYITHGGDRRAAIVCYVHANEATLELGMVNLTVLDRDGHTYAEIDVRFAESKPPAGRFGAGHFWEWARKTLAPPTA